MHKRFLITGFLVVVFILINGKFACAQSDRKTFDLGGQVSLIHAHKFDPRLFSEDKTWDPGFGVRFTVNVTENIGVEAELNFFSNADDSLRQGKKTQGLFGIKAGRRGSNLGLFGKLRPGFMRFGEVFDCPGADSTSCGAFAKTYFSVDLGGVAEYYPTGRTVVRFDIGDTVIRFNRITVPDAASEVPRAIHSIDGKTTHNLQIGIGVGIRF